MASAFFPTIGPAYLSDHELRRNTGVFQIFRLSENVEKVESRFPGLEVGAKSLGAPAEQCLEPAYAQGPRSTNDSGIVTAAREAQLENRVPLKMPPTD